MQYMYPVTFLTGFLRTDANPSSKGTRPVFFAPFGRVARGVPKVLDLEHPKTQRLVAEPLRRREGRVSCP